MSRSLIGLPLAKLFLAVIRHPSSTRTADPEPSSQSDAPLVTSCNRSSATRRKMRSTGAGSRRQRQTSVARGCVCIDSVSAVEPQ